MASLMENLIDTLEKLCTEYDQLLELSSRKTPVIVSGNLQELAKITDEEQLLVSRINNLEKQNDATLKDIANVINMDVNEIKLAGLVKLLANRPEEQTRLETARTNLKKIVTRVQDVNIHNGQLLNEALEMVQYEMNVLQAMKAAPETANYNRSAYNDGSVIGATRSGFDAKQ